MKVNRFSKFDRIIRPQGDWIKKEAVMCNVKRTPVFPETFLRTSAFQQERRFHGEAEVYKTPALYSERKNRPLEWDGNTVFCLYLTSNFEYCNFGGMVEWCWISRQVSNACMCISDEIFRDRNQLINLQISIITQRLQCLNIGLPT